METDNSIWARQKYVSGVRGWLIVFLVVLVWRIRVFLYFDGSDVLMFLERWSNWAVWISFTRGVIYVFELLAPFWIGYVLVRRRRYALRWTKGLLLIAPLTAFISYFHDTPYSLLDLKFRFFLTLFAFTIPWLAYFSVSMRVRNTYMFTEPMLPSTIQCPGCAVKLNLSRSEKESRSVVCPECKTLIQEGKVVA